MLFTSVFVLAAIKLSNALAVSHGQLTPTLGGTAVQPLSVACLNPARCGVLPSGGTCCPGYTCKSSEVGPVCVRVGVLLSSTQVNLLIQIHHLSPVLPQNTS
jgi:hypothetical protein